MLTHRAPDLPPTLPRPDPALRRFRTRQRWGLLAGPLAFGLTLLIPFSGLSPAGRSVLATAVLMAVWWLSESLPLAATALLPLVLFPFLGVKSTASVAAHYMDRNILLFMGGFFIAMAMQRWRLHRRLALTIVGAVGTGGRRLVLGFMIATAALSMWISNTATTMMMLPIVMAVILELAPGEEGFSGEEAISRHPLAASLLLGVAYAASIGGLATLVGTPPNIVFATALASLYPQAPPIGFFQWMQVGLPLAVVFLFLAWLYLTRVAFKVGRGEIGESSREALRQQREGLGPWSRGEVGVGIVFLLAAIGWVWRADLSLGVVTIPGWTTLLGLSGVDDATVAIAAALLLFAIPTDRSHGWFLLDWHWAVRIPWGVLILFGGGIALAGAFAETGLAAWIGQRLHVLGQVPVLLMVVSVCVLMTFLTEITSNTATATVFMPVMAATAMALGTDPLLLMIPAALSASCAFMLPVATPPNAIVFGSGQITLPEMARAGFALNWVGAALIPIVVYLVAVPVFGILLGGTPGWAS